MSRNLTTAEYAAMLRQRGVTNPIEAACGAPPSTKSSSIKRVARVIAKNRHIQLKAFELILHAAKLEARVRPELSRRIGIPFLEATQAKTLQ